MGKICSSCGVVAVDLAKFCGKCGCKFDANLNQAKVEDVFNETENELKDSKINQYSHFKDDVINYSSVTLFENDYTFLSKNMIRDKNTWDDYFIEIDEELLYLFQNNKGIKAIKIAGLKDSFIANNLKSTSKQSNDELSWWWWNFWAWANLTLGNLYIAMVLKNLEESIVAIGFYSSLMVLVLMHNKYAFLIATILSLNPIVWIINGIYLKNRWSHPKINNGKKYNEA